MSYFKEISKINYEGPESKNPLSFKYYNPDEIVNGKTMKEQLRFAMSYWHTFTFMGVDPFGKPTMQRSWDATEDEMEKAIERVHVAFEFMEKA
ncbi:MAG TPA: xylose isomerase, partial [Candidatus Merdenecus merdavium]|nr:xylose isomerase [Candidatus Merdenecus merdavium]